METKETILKFISKQRARHSLTLKSGVIVKGGTTFEALLSDIPKAFRDVVQIVSAGDSTQAKALNPEQHTPPKMTRQIRLEEKKAKKAGEEEAVEKTIEKTKPVKTYVKKHVGRGKYNVLDEEGKIMNEKPLTGIKAMQLIDGLTK